MSTCVLITGAACLIRARDVKPFQIPSLKMATRIRDLTIISK